MKQHILCKENEFIQYKRQQIARFTEQKRLRRVVNYARMGDVPVWYIEFSIIQRLLNH
jgi:hypothetical protein